MHRQFTSAGLERDIARWLKEIGYRGQGLKKESLLPICRGEMVEYWDALIQFCRPPNEVEEMKNKLNVKLQRQAVLEARQKSIEESERVAKQIERIRKLEQQSMEEEQELEKLKSHVAQLKNDLIKTDAVEMKRTGTMQSDVQRAKILTSFARKIDEAEETLKKEVQHLNNHVQQLKTTLAENNQDETGTGEFDSLMESMHRFTCSHINHHLLNKKCQQHINPQDLIPKITSKSETDDSVRNGLISSIGQLYSRRSLELTKLFTAASAAQLFVAVQCEAKYARDEPISLKDLATSQAKAIENMHLSHLKEFVSSRSAEDENEEQLKTLKESNTVQRYLTAVSQSGMNDLLNYVLDGECLRSEIEVLERQKKSLQAEIMQQNGLEEETKQLYAQMRAHVEHSEQLDVLIHHVTELNQQLKEEFEETRAMVALTLEAELPVSMQGCSNVLKSCQNIIRNELDAFLKLDLNNRPKLISLSETASDHHHQPSTYSIVQRHQLLSRCDSGCYWISSIKEVMRELRQTVLELRLEAPDALFGRLMEALRVGLSTSHAYRCLVQKHDLLKEEAEEIGASVEELKQREKQHEEQVAKNVKDVDDLLQNAHETLRLLSQNVSTALMEFEEVPVFSSVFWMQREAKCLSQWIASRQHDNRP